ncbi:MULTISPECIES: hypothetical protein [Clostridium]|jgi:hypothetical protein|uniref:hypothetical protein n=1 Tax=Clostridium TaxID=1485 RepID=UPI000E974429|nr:hypothetical protein [Clostridium tyrobutyricum]HBF77163.1 hypothetical protein [Clostridiaceae bacterium]
MNVCFLINGTKKEYKFITTVKELAKDVKEYKDENKDIQVSLIPDGGMEKPLCFNALIVK